MMIMEDFSGNARHLLMSLGLSNRRRSQHWVSGIFARPSASAQTTGGNCNDRHARATTNGGTQTNADTIVNRRTSPTSRMPLTEAPNELVKSIRSRDWQAVHCHLRLCPADANSRIVDHNLATPLHLACIFRAPHDIITSLVQLYPQALLHQDTEGWLPLHVNLLYGTDEETTLFLIHAGGAQTSCVQSKFVGAPLHLACRHGSSARVLWALLAQRPDVVTLRTDSGGYPSNLLFRSFLRVSQSTIMSGIHTTSEAAAAAAEAHDRGFVRQLDIFLIASHGKNPPPLAKTTSTRNRERPHLRDVIVFQNKFAMETNYLLMAMKLYPHTAATDMVDDVPGPFPLHVAALYPVRTMPEQLWPHKVPVPLDPLKILNQMCPEQFVVACERTDSSGRLALHMALDQGHRGWREGIDVLVASYPESLLKHDPVTGLLPFQLAAAATSAEPETKYSSVKTTETIFRLLLAYPHACRVATGTNYSQ
jgi:ankyrin repeat protein